MQSRLEDFRDNAPAAFPPPPLPEVLARGRRRTSRKVVLAGALLATAAAVVTVLVFTVTALRPLPEPPAPVATSIGEVDWTRTELILPAAASNSCPRGKVRLYPRDSVYLGHIGQTRRDFNDYSTPLFAIAPGEIYGDLTGDGLPEAVLEIRCVKTVPDGMMAEEGGQLLVVSMRPDHTLVALGFVGVVHAQYPRYRVDSGTLYVTMRYNSITPNSFGYSADDTAYTAGYRWNGSTFQQVSGRAGNLSFGGGKESDAAPVRLVEIQRDGVVVCPAATVRFWGGEATAGGCRFSQGKERGTPIDLTGDGDDELVVAINCQGPGYDAASVYVFGQGATSFEPIDVPFVNDGSYDLETLEVIGRTLTLTLVRRATGATETRALTWTAGHFR